ncbi:hypothetical protein, partial [Micromonospora deserti]
MSLSGAAEPPAAESLPALFPVPEPAAVPPAPRPAPPPRSRRGTRADSSGSAAGDGDDAAPGQRADVPAAGDAAEGAGPDEARRQLVFFGAEAADPSVADLAGLLAGPGEVAVMGGTARLSVVVDAAWRVHVLAAELTLRGLAPSWEPTDDARHAVRTSYTRVLKPLAVAWLRGTAKRPPPGFHLNGRRLRLWLAAAGLADPPDFLLRFGGADPDCWAPVGAALAAVGLPDAQLEAGPDGPAYRITGRRHLARLAELVG